MKKLLLSFCLIFSALPLFAQDVLLEETVDTSLLQKKFGPNQAHYIQFCYRMGLVIPTSSDEMESKVPASGMFGVGLRYKRKITGLLAVGLEADYRSQSARLAGGRLRPFPDTLFTANLRKHDFSKLHWQEFGVGGFVRINFDPFRGNYLGKFLDIGGGPRVLIGRNYTTVDEEGNGTVTRTTYSRFPYTKLYNFEAFARLGVSNFNLEAHYRFSPFWKEAYNFPEPPRLIVNLAFTFSGGN